MTLASILGRQFIQLAPDQLHQIAHGAAVEGEAGIGRLEERGEGTRPPQGQRGPVIGHGLGLKRKGSAARVFTLFSDGELDEGVVWEALMSAAHYKLDNLIAIVDVNNQQADGPSTQVMAFEPLAPKMEAFGWYTQRIDGNDLGAVIDAFDRAVSHAAPVPRMIVCDTRMGCGVPFLEAREKNHFIRVDAHEWKLAIEALDAGRRA